jgi:hypothetical protein
LIQVILWDVKKECLAAREWQQCESRDAATAGLAKGRNGPVVSATSGVVASFVPQCGRQQ